MEILPGIDLMQQQCVCPLHRPYSTEVLFSHDPAEMAAILAEQGAHRFYVADRDGARTGSPQNLEAVKRVIDAGRIPVDLGGGIRSIETAEKVLEMGVDRIVVGTTAALQEDFAKEIFRHFDEHVVVSVASLNGYVAVRDWQARTDERAVDFAKRMSDLGAKHIVFTDVDRKGLHGGTNVSAIRRLARTIQTPIIASGGIGSLSDVRELKKLEPLGVEGMIVVTAIYSGRIKLADAIEIVQSEVEQD